MKQNIKIAKQLIKLAKELIAYQMNIFGKTPCQVDSFPSSRIDQKKGKTGLNAIGLIIRYKNNKKSYKYI